MSENKGLAALRVLEISDTPGASFAASLLGDFGATVLIAEAPPAGARMRAAQPGHWWSVLARNKASLALDPGAPGAAAVIARVLESVDLVITDRAPPERAAHPWLHGLSAGAKAPLLVEVFPTGADRPELWPWSKRADMTAAATGLMAVTGHRDGPPLQPEFPLAEYLAGAMAMLRALAELRALKLGRGANMPVEVPLHAAVLRMIEWQIPVATSLGRAEIRDANTFPMNAGIGNMHLTKDGKYMAVSAASQAVAAKLMMMVGGEKLRDDPRFVSPEARAAGLADMYRLMDAWFAERTAAEVMAEALRNDVVLGPIYDTDDLAREAHLRARNNIVQAPDAQGRMIDMPGVVPTIYGIDAGVRHGGPRLGEGAEAALAQLGYAPAEIAALRNDGALWA